MAEIVLYRYGVGLREDGNGNIISRIYDFRWNTVTRTVDESTEENIYYQEYAKPSDELVDAYLHEGKWRQVYHNGTGGVVFDDQPALQATYEARNLSCFGADNGQISITVTSGQGPVQYSWSDGGPPEATRINLAPGFYSVTLTDQPTGQTLTFSDIQIQGPGSQLTATHAKTNVGCRGLSTGSIQVFPAGGWGGYSFLWNDLSTSQNRSNLPAGVYSVVVRDGGGCSVTIPQIVISEPATGLEVEKIVTNNNVKLIASGGVGPYSYTWNDGVTGSERIDLQPGTYTCTVGDTNGCTRPVTVEIVDFRFYFSKNPVILAVSATNPQTKPNLSFVLEVHVEKVYRSGNFEKVLQVEQPADSGGKTTFDVKKILDGYVEPHLPAFEQRTLVRADKMFKRYFLRYAEKYGSPEPTLQEFRQLLTNYVIHGGLTDAEYVADTFFTDYLPQKMPFFTWEPNNKPVPPDGQEYLYYLHNSFDYNSFKVKVKVYFSDYTFTEATLFSREDVLRYEMYVIPAGYTQLNLPAIDPTKAVVAWEIYCTDPGNTLVTERRRFQLDNEYYPNRRFFLYLNSIGGYNTLFATGAASRSVDIDADELSRILPAKHDLAEGPIATISKTGQEILSLSSGYKNQPYISALQDFTKSIDIKWIHEGRFVPVSLSADTVELEDDQNTVPYLPFKVRPPKDSRYTPKL